MEQALKIALFMILQALAWLHAYWGLGGLWPGTDERSLVEHVIGRTPGMQMPGMIACFFVAFCLFEVSALVLFRGNVIALPPPWSHFVRPLLWLAAAVFLLRGAAGYIPALFAYAEGTPFYSLNQWLYSPLCLAIGAGLLVFDRITPLATERA